MRLIDKRAPTNSLGSSHLDRVLELAVYGRSPTRCWLPATDLRVLRAVLLDVVHQFECDVGNGIPVPN